MAEETRTITEHATHHIIETVYSFGDIHRQAIFPAENGTKGIEVTMDKAFGGYRVSFSCWSGGVETPEDAEYKAKCLIIAAELGRQWQSEIDKMEIK